MFKNGVPGIPLSKEWSTHKKLAFFKMMVDAGTLPWATFSGNPLQFRAQKAHTLRSTEVAFSPKQDLHGYDAPWPAGGGVNKLPIPVWFEAGYSVTIYGVTFTVQSDGGIKVKGTASTTADFRLSDATMTPAVNEFAVGEGTWSFDCRGVSNSAHFLVNGSASNEFPYSDRTVDGLATGTVTDGEQPFRYIYIRVPSGAEADTVVYVQLISGSTRPEKFYPYSNICPITGWNSIDVMRAGENLLNDVDPLILNAYFTIATVSAENLNHRMVVIPCVPSTAYTFTWNRVAISGTQTARVCTFTSEPTYGSSGSLMAANVAENGSATFTTGANDRYIAIYMGDIRTTDFQASLSASMLSLGASASPHSQYTGETTTLTFGQTVYGGTAEVAEDGTGTGSGTYGIVDLGTLEWIELAIAGVRHGYYTTLSDAKLVQNGEAFNGIAEQYAAIRFNAITTGDGLIALRDNGILYVTDSVSPTGQLVYELATPVPFTVTPSATPTAVAGINTIWSNANGDVTVEARGEAVNLSALQSLNMLLGGRYVNNHTDEDLTDEEALDVILGGQR